MTRMFTAKALARMHGCVTFARIAFDGPVLKNRKKTARKMNDHAYGNGVQSMRITRGQEIQMPAADTRKYEPGYRLRSASPAMPPSSVAAMPATTVIPP